MASIGETLREARDAAGLSLQDVHEATKITSQNLAALEEDRFDSFPNRVYARAFLRDYANYLGLDSAALLVRYEDEWCREPEASAAPARRSGSLARKLAYLFAGLLVLGALAAGAYFTLEKYGRKTPPGVGARPRVEDRSGEVAHLPKASVPSNGNETAAQPKPADQPKPEAEPVPPPAPEKLVLEVTTLRPVWVEVRTDGVTAAYATLPTGTRTFEAKKQIYIKVGQADGVRLKENGKPVPPLGTRAVRAERTFTLPEAPVPPAPQGGAPAPVVPAAPSAPPASPGG